jgi:hypothetical protein
MMPLALIFWRSSMGFVNEYISDVDVKKYNLKEVDKKYVVGGVCARDWTIDRDRDIYLRMVSRGREEIAHQTTWTFFWNGELIEVGIDFIDSTGGVGKPSWGRKRIRKLTLPDSLANRREEVIEDLKEALTAYKDGGVFSKSTSYSLTLEY